MKSSRERRKEEKKERRKEPTGVIVALCQKISHLRISYKFLCQRSQGIDFVLPPS
jgi:hypothetical protein